MLRGDRWVEGNIKITFMHGHWDFINQLININKLRLFELCSLDPEESKFRSVEPPTPALFHILIIIISMYSKQQQQKHQQHIWLLGQTEVESHIKYIS